MRNLLKEAKNHWKLILLLVYILSPVDIIPDFLMPFGLGDDLLLSAIAVINYFRKRKK